MNIADNKWRILYKKGNVPRYGSDGLKFQFPTLGSSVNYVVSKISELRNNINITINIKASHDAVFQHVGAGAGMQPNCRLFIMKNLRSPKGNDTDAIEKQFERWWSTDCIILRPGKHQLVIPLIPPRWSSVYGISGDKVKGKFHRAVDETTYVGITFGGGSHYGHGVYMEAGIAKFELVKFEI